METGQVGAKLRETRVARGISLEDIASATKIPRSMLQNLEADSFQKMPAPVFVRGFIRAYAKVVGLDPNPIVRAFEQRTTSDATPIRPLSEADPGARGARTNKPGATDPNSAATGPRDRKLVPLEPVSERSEGMFRPGYLLLAVVAIGLLIAAWLMVGGQRQGDTTARGTAPGATGTGSAQVNDPGGPSGVGTPALHERIDGIPSLDGRGDPPRIR